MVYLFIQAIEMILLIGRPWLVIHNRGYLLSTTDHPLLTTIVLIYFFLLMGLISLMFYHVYFMLANMTTWEYISWNEITYLEGFEKKDGSPFSVSSLANLCIYMKPHEDAFYDWVPTKPRK